MAGSVITTFSDGNICIAHLFKFNLKQFEAVWSIAVTSVYYLNADNQYLIINGFTLYQELEKKNAYYFPVLFNFYVITCQMSPV